MIAAFFGPSFAPRFSMALAAGPDDLIIAPSGLQFRRVPAGRFTMGAGPDFIGVPHYELPAHEVSITRSFRLSVYETTVENWKKVMGSLPARQGRPKSPVVNVSWDDVQSFLRKLGEMDGRVYRLPTEAEWEYAARAGTSTAFHFGSSDSRLSEYAWCGGIKAGAGLFEVGVKLPNPWGLYDMYGNAAEWVSDWYGEDYYSQKASPDPKGPSSGTMRGVRGGSAESHESACQSAWREGDLPMVRSGHIGFRAAFDE
ncbi:MAG: formylglycine-generating enzyme family protein [Deltaproteobacteria bacterium]|nr:formylglycine-generating enzyme family protein [Deltaproteobacteria bacterium]